MYNTYKMKEVCQMTGLTEKAIRIYMDQKLVHPKVEEGVHRKAYFFSDEDVERLKDIAALRNAGFGIAEIKQMQENPQMLSLLIEERKELLEGEILQKQVIQDTLKKLTIEEHSDVRKLADAIEPRTTYAKETPKKKLSRKARWFVLLLVLGVLLGWSVIASGKAGVCIFLISCGLVFGIEALLFGVRYLLYNAKMQKKDSRGLGKITAVVENEKIEEYIGEKERSIGKEIMAYLTFGLFGEGLWNMLRPDAWYPVISYQTEDGTVHTATTRYGAFRSTWKVGDSVKLTWEDGKERLVHVCGSNAFRKKAYVYLILAAVLLAVFGVGVWELFGKQEQDMSDSVISQKLEYPMDADRVEVRMGSRSYELNEEETEVLKRLLAEAEYKGAEKYRLLGTDGVVAFYFYQGETEIAKIFTNDYFCIYTGTMKYWVDPPSLEFHGIDLGDTEYITICLGSFGAKVRERYAVEEIMGCISEKEELEDLKILLQTTEYYDGAYIIESGYQFLFSQQGFVNYFGRLPKENEIGKVEVILENGEFVSAVVMSYCYNEIGEVETETYRKEWLLLTPTPISGVIGLGVKKTIRSVRPMQTQNQI